MIKVQILDICPACNGKAYLPIGKSLDNKGRTYTRYAPCLECEGSGLKPRWVSLPEFDEMLKQALCKHEHTSHIGGMHFSAGDVWDDIEEVCDDCGAKLSG